MGLVNEPATIWQFDGEYSPETEILATEDSVDLTTETSVEISTEGTFVGLPGTIWEADSTPPSTTWAFTSEPVPATTWAADTTPPATIWAFTSEAAPATVWAENDGA